MAKKFEDVMSELLDETDQQDDATPTQSTFDADLADFNAKTVTDQMSEASSPDVAEAGVGIVRANQVANDIQGHGVKYLDALESYTDAPDEVVAEHAMDAVKSKHPNAVQAAAIWEYRRRAFPINNELANKSNWKWNTAMEIGSLLDAVLTRPIKTAGRVAGDVIAGRDVDIGKSWDKSKESYIDNLITLGLPKWGAYLAGGGLEIITDLSLLTGLGAGMKTVAGAGGEFAQQAAKQGANIAGVTSKQIGIYLRSPRTGQRILHGIPGTERVGNFLSKAIPLGKKFVKAGEPLDGSLRALFHMSEGDAAECAYNMRRAMSETVDRMKGLNLTKPQLSNASIAQEYVKDLRAGGAAEAMAKRKLAQMGLSDNELKAANLLADGYEALGDVVKKYNLPMEGLEDLSRRKEEVSALIDMAKEKFDKSLKRTVDREEAASLAESIAERVSRLGGMEPEEAMKTLREYHSYIGSKAEKWGKRSGLSKSLKEADELTRDIERMSSIGTATTQDAVSEARDMLSNRLGELNTKMQTPTGRYAAAIEATNAYEQLTGVIQRLDKMHPEELRSVLGKVATSGQISDKTATGLPQVAYDIQEIYNAQSLAKKHAEFYRDLANKVKGSSANKLTRYEKLLSKAERLDTAGSGPGWGPRVSSTERLGKKAVPRAMKENDLLDPQTFYSIDANPMSKSGAMKKRTWLDEGGESRYLWDIEQDFRGLRAFYETGAESGGLFDDMLTDFAKQAKSRDGAIKLGKEMMQSNDSFAQFVKRLASDGNVGAENIDEAIELAYSISKSKSKLTQYAQEMFGSDKPSEIIKGINESLQKGESVVGKFFELDPTLSFGPYMNRIRRDVLNEKMLEGMRLIASDVKAGINDIPAEVIGGRIGEMYKGKFFPAEIKTELDEWTKAANRWNKDLPEGIQNVAKLHDWALNFWKIEKTAPWPGFRFRNATSDYFRYSTLGPFNPLSIEKDGYRALFRSSKTIDCGELGKLTGDELRDLAEAYGISGGFFAEMGLEGKKIWQRPLRSLSYGEDVRRIGAFADQLRKVGSPIEAARNVKRVFFDYSDLAPWEKMIMKRIVPFYTFLRKNMEFQVKTMFSQPWFLNTQLKALKGRSEFTDKLMELTGEYDVGDWVPQDIRGNMPIITREAGLISLMNGIGFDSKDVVEIMDIMGHPKGEFNALGEYVWDRLTPFKDKQFISGIAAAPRIFKNLITGASPEQMKDVVDTFSFPDISTKESGELVSIPNGAEKLPQRIKDALGIREEKVQFGRRFHKKLMMPSGSVDFMRSFRFMSELMKWARIDRTKETSDQWAEGLAATLVGITNRQITDTEAKYMIIRERRDSIIREMKDKGYLTQYGDITKSGRRTSIGKEFRKIERDFYKAVRARERERERKRDEERRVVPD